MLIVKPGLTYKFYKCTKRVSGSALCILACKLSPITSIKSIKKTYANLFFDQWMVYAADQTESFKSLPNLFQVAINDKQKFNTINKVLLNVLIYKNPLNCHLRSMLAPIPDSSCLNNVGYFVIKFSTSEGFKVGSDFCKYDQI